MSHKILFVIHRMDYGGAPKVMAFLANRLSLEGNDVYLLTYEDMTLMQDLVPEVKHVGFPHSAPSVFAFRRIYQVIQLRNLLGQIKPDAVVSFLTYPNMLSICAGIGTHIPIIISQRSDPSTPRNWFARLRDFMYNFADGCVFQTPEAKNYYNKRIQDKCAIIPNPVLADVIPPAWSGQREDFVVHVGRFELYQKRQDVLIKAFSRIANKYPNVRLVLYGDGADEPSIRRLISECHLEDRIVLPGVTRNIYEAIRRARVFVLSSDYEGIPNALIEALSLGLPCISTDYAPGGAAKLIKNMESGILVRTGCVDELANAMDFMLDNPQLAEAMGRKALEIRNDLDADSILERWTEHIHDRISAKSPEGQQ